MSECVVEVCQIQKILPHTNADALELAHIKGWQVCVPKGRYHEGDLVTYIPINSMIPIVWADKWGITKYLSTKPSEPNAGRVKCARLRGEPSFGVIVDLGNPSWVEGYDVKAYYGIFKFIPPLRPSAGDEETPHSLFIEYTEIENLRNFPGVLVEGEEVLVTEKIHGTNVRVGIIEGQRMAGSHHVRRKEPPEEQESNLYWFPWTILYVKDLLETLAGDYDKNNYSQVILFGEVYGAKVQSLNYGLTNKIGFRAFDLFVNGEYISQGEFISLCEKFNVEYVPCLYSGPFSTEKIIELSQGKTAVGADHIKEGVVVRPKTERTDPKIGRVILKYIGDQYLFSKDAEKEVEDK